MLQIQPLYRHREEYTELAKREGLSFEVLELNFPYKPEVRSWYEGCGLVSSLHGAFIDVNPGSTDRDFRALSQKKCRESCELALGIGAGRAVFHSSCFPNLRGAYLEGWLAHAATFYQELAEQYPLEIFLENSFDLDPEPLALLLEQTAHPRVKACLDVGHALCSRVSVSAWAKRLAPQLGYVHLSDNYGEFDDHIPLGRGRLDWQELRPLLAQLPGDMPMTLEVGDLSGIRESLDFLKEQNILGG